MSSGECSVEAQSRRLGMHALGAPRRAPKAASEEQSSAAQTCTRTPPSVAAQPSATASKALSPFAASPHQRKCCTYDSGLLTSSTALLEAAATACSPLCSRATLARSCSALAAPSAVSRAVIVATAPEQPEGGQEAEKQYPAPERRWWSTRPLRPAQKPPTPATVCSREPTMASTRLVSTPKCSHRPPPPVPSTPKERDSSRISSAPYFSLSANSSGSAASCPVRWLRPSTTMKVLCESAESFFFLSALGGACSAASMAFRSPCGVQVTSALQSLRPVRRPR
mmetsp:Transcript_57889/g.148901  ORF Transcript_57889/g.148901 Transcript_57889/m.148901 type:complete len:282 (-) Transcript_57889:2503-3348(-)